jgi:TolB-like protein/tetratricopeptide (TPR) repeat protein
MSLFEELKRRNVFRVGIAYIVAAWLLVQIADLALDIVGAEDWVLRSVAILLALGFIPTVIFAWAFELTPEGVKREKDVNRDASITRHTAKKLDFVTIGLLLAVVVVVAVDRFLPGDLGSESNYPSDETAATPEDGNLTLTPALPADKPPAKSVAVLPFVNMSEDANNEYFSDGISEEILNALAKVDDLKVAGRTSSFAFKGQNQDLREIGVALNVSHILEGSVRKAGNRVRVTAQLIKVDDGYHVWSENYDRELDDIFAIQDEISASILDQLKAHLVGGETTTVARTDSKAYDLYLLASQRIYERNEASQQMASDLLTEAISIDPNYAPAYAQLGIATMLLSEDSYGSIPVGEVYDIAKAHLDRALELDPQQAEAMAGLGLHAQQGLLDLNLSVEWLEKALAINPNLTNANVWLSTALSEQGNQLRAIEILQASFARDPLHPPTFNNLSLILFVTGQTDAARDMLLGLKRFLPSDATLVGSIGKVEVMAGNWAEADRLLTEALEREPLNFVDRIWWSATAFGTHQFERVAEMGTSNFKALALDQLGRTEEALIEATQWANNGNNPDNILEILVRHGRFEEAIEFIESRWPNLDALEAAFPNRGGFGAQTLNFLAQAYSQEGNETKFNETMRHAADALQAQVSTGANNWVLHTSIAHHAMLAGDYDGALESLNQVVAMGGLPRVDFTGEYSAFAPLRGDPRFEAILDRIHEHQNEERAELGLDPLSA